MSLNITNDYRHTIAKMAGQIFNYGSFAASGRAYQINCIDSIIAEKLTVNFSIRIFFPRTACSMFSFWMIRIEGYGYGGRGL
jgi:hypothetical protein